MMQRVLVWVTRHPGRVDAIFATLFLLFAILTGPGQTRVAALSGLGMIIALYFRRTNQFAAFGICTVFALSAVILVRDQSAPIAVADLAVPLVLHAIIRYSQLVWFRRVALITAIAGAFLSPLRRGTTPAQAYFIEVFFALTVVMIAYLIGAYQRRRTEFNQQELASVVERNRLLEIEREQTAQIAIAGERNQIAAETHDIVAHSLAVIVSQADGALMAAAGNPDAKHAALAQIAQTSREALDEIRGRVAQLRAGADGGALELHPTRSLADLPALAESISRTGLDVDLDQQPIAQEIPPSVQLATYRIIQEALTNVIKHAGPGAEVQVVIGQDQQAVRLSVRDDGRGSATVNDGGGNGLLGMRERVAHFGGSLHAAPAVGGGFEVVATLPLDHRPQFTADDRSLG